MSRNDEKFESLVGLIIIAAIFLFLADPFIAHQLAVAAIGQPASVVGVLDLLQAVFAIHAELILLWLVFLADTMGSLTGNW